MNTSSHRPANARNSWLSSWFQRGTASQNLGAAGQRSLCSKTKATTASTISAPFDIQPPMTVNSQKLESRAVAVFCGSSTGREPAFAAAAKSLGKAIAEASRPLVYGGGSAGTMGIVSGAALEGGGDVLGVIPFAMVAAGGEVEQTKDVHKPHIQLKEKGREKVVVNSLHERKAEMAKRSCAFIGLPGGYGTFEEVLEVVCWSQVGIHNKPVIVLNVRGFYEPLRELIRNGVREGFIVEKNEHLVRFVDGPAERAEHEAFDWGTAAMATLDEWQAVGASHFYNWHLRKDGKEEDTLGAT
ncbi:hypothetical protein BC628DRAFT_1407337 [Trametes gibbosa]|nr:hypothetical protein BC628DRAFT_1407337 [Trametes gibbosa]